MIETPVRLNTSIDSKAFCAQWDVYLDGVKQSDCVLADTQHGYVIRYRRTFGMIMAQRGRPPLTERKNGVVTIVPKDQPLGI